MSLHVYECEQRSDEWLQARCGIVTASVVGGLLTPTLKVASNDTSRALIATLASERILGYAEPSTYMPPDMWRGVEEEPRARDRYAEVNGAEVTEVGLLVRDDWGWSLGYSPDGLVGEDGLLEVKAPKAKTHVRTVISGEVPDHYMPQIQAGLLVSGRAWLDWVPWFGGLPLWTKRVYPDPRWQEAIVAAVSNFETECAELVASYNAAVEGLPSTDRLDLEVVV